MTSQSRSISTSVLVSSYVSCLPPPLPVFSQKKPDNSGRKVTFIAGTNQSTKVTTPARVLISNEEILNMYEQVMRQMQDQNKISQMLLREIKNLKTERQKLTEVPTPLVPRAIDFGSSRNHSGDFISMQDPGASQELGIFRNNIFNPVPSHLMSSSGNITTYSTPDTNAYGWSQESGISPQVAKEIKILQDMISGVPGIVKPIPEVSPTAHRVSRFTPPICELEIPKRFQTPNMKLYDGTTDPEEHVTQY